MSETVAPYYAYSQHWTNREVEDLLNMYCDLTWRQYQHLLDLASGNQPSHGAKAVQADMPELVSQHYVVTWHGQQVLNRAIGLIEKAWTPLVRESRIQNPTRTAIWAKKEYDGGHWIRSVHLKLVNALWVRPGQSYRYLTRIYGHTVIEEFLQRELATGKAMRGSALRLSPLGEKLAYWCFRLEAQR